MSQKPIQCILLGIVIAGCAPVKTIQIESDHPANSAAEVSRYEAPFSAILEKQSTPVVSMPSGHSQHHDHSKHGHSMKMTEGGMAEKSEQINKRQDKEGQHLGH